MMKAKSHSPIWNGTADIFWYNEARAEFTISTAEQLAGLAKLVNWGVADFKGKTVKLGANIRLNNAANWRKWDKRRPKNEWMPIGETLTIGGTPAEHEHITRYFLGVFDGCGFVVSGIYINSSHACGLFGVLDDGTVKNLGVVDSYIKGEVCIGGVVGDFSGTMSNCYAKAWVSGQTIGGLVGSNCGDISNCYSAGMLTWIGKKKKYVGGLAGGGISNITNSYYDSAVSGIIGTSGEGKSTKEMKDKATFEGWDFEKVWGIDEKINDGYPYLRSI